MGKKSKGKKGGKPAVGKNNGGKETEVEEEDTEEVTPETVEIKETPEESTTIKEAVVETLVQLEEAVVASSSPEVAAPEGALAGRITSACYVEVNSYRLGNVSAYSLSDGQNAFDIGIIFAANIGADENKSAVLKCNANVDATLVSGDVQLLQSKGIKVLLSVLGDHEGVGLCSFPSEQAADAFAQTLAQFVSSHGLDGVDLDDEWADYPEGALNGTSFVHFVSALRKHMPDKIVSFYCYGPAADRLSSDGVQAGPLLTYSWNPAYGTFAAPAVPGMRKAALSPAAISFDQSVDLFSSLAAQTKQEGYGACLFYNLPNGDQSATLSLATQHLYGSAVFFTQPVVLPPLAALAAEVVRAAEAEPEPATEAPSAPQPVDHRPSDVDVEIIKAPAEAPSTAPVTPEGAAQHRSDSPAVAAAPPPAEGGSDAKAKEAERLKHINLLFCSTGVADKEVNCSTCVVC